MGDNLLDCAMDVRSSANGPRRAEIEGKPMNHPRHSDPAEQSALMRLFYRNWRPTRLGRRVNQFSGWWSALGLPPRFQAVLEVRGRKSGRTRSNPVVIATVEACVTSYRCSVLGLIG